MKDEKVTAIITGSVFDHIPFGKAVILIKLFGLNGKYPYLMGSGLKSEKSPDGKKDIIKIEGKELTEEEINILSLIAPSVTVSIIRDGKVFRKIKTELPERVSRIIICNNTKCITSIDKNSDTEFIITKRSGEIFLKCKYCGREYKIDDVKIVI
ncbi:MAG: aspartate carbamoyltransferase regulatory subunit [Patescibacteria group bacterium]|nr:aspartate carbamoyltransferase regulatory subunit [Patescibacteria group bacterium]MDD4304348.1 aspartate carbamoyltransferase regulatory subunit [Patescibacteria group bacterium]MDD4695371.1 aspartate carbamoyltransferase regulatory subunit [Patescibacteria group bacterium]